MSTSDIRGGGFRHRVHERLDQFRRKSRSSSRDANGASDLRNLGNPDELNRLPYRQSQDLSIQVDGPGQSSSTEDNATRLEAEQEAAISRPHPSDDQDVEITIGRPDIGVSIEVSSVPSDLWSAAYREAVNNLGKEIDIAILKRDNIADLFKQLEKIDKDTTQESAFLRGVKYLQSLQVPLERFKLALDLASPLTSIEPTTATVFGVVKGVTAIAISFSTADLDFAKKIGEMLEQLSYIDDCDTLGQKTNKEDIHRALVSVYQKLLEFYNAAFKILNRKGVKLVMKIVLENGRLPEIVRDFLRHSDLLRKLVQKATWEIVEDIKVMLYDHEIAGWLGSGKMSRQSQRHADLQEMRDDKACEFLLAKTEFIKWYNATDCQQLVIVGEMGSGKSVAMAYLVDELRRRNEHQLPQPKICYHYCQNDGSGQAIYVFCVLILSVLEQLPGLKRTFFEWYKRTVATGIEPATSFKTLEGWLLNILETLDRPFVFAIDGLDECDRQSRQRLLNSLKRMSQDTSRLKILLSTRPEEEIQEQLNGMSKIVMESNTARDRLIVEKTVETRLFYLPDQVKALVIEALSHSARGSAIWTRMMVELIEIRAIKALNPMRAFLDKIPQPRQLWELYANLYSRYTADDPENQILATTALKILAAARRPLSMLELGWAVALGAADETVRTVVALSQLVDYQRVMSLIQPFVAHVDFANATQRQVKLVHQSVKEFVVGSSALNLHHSVSLSGAISTTAASLPATLLQQRTESLEAGITAICIRYLLLHEIDLNSLFSEERLALEELPQDSDLFDDYHVPNDFNLSCSWEAWEQDMIHYDPTERGFGELFAYASCHWIEHFGAISTEALLPRLSDIELLCRAGSTRLHNWIAQNCRPDCAIRARFVFDSTLYDPLGITSLYGPEIMLLRILEHSDFGEDAFLPNAVMQAADQILQWGDLSRLRLLWGSRVGHQIRNLEFFRLVLEQWSRFTFDKYREGWGVVFSLLDDAHDAMTEERWGSTLLSKAASVGCMPVVRRLFDAAQHHVQLRNELLDISRCENGLIGTAVLGDHVDVVEYLLGQQGMEPHFQHRNACGENVLHLASRICNPEIFQLLVPRLKANVYQRDKQGDTVFTRIVMSSSASRDRYEAARILIAEVGNYEHGRFFDEQQAALRAAMSMGDLEMCRLFHSGGY